MLKFVKNWVRKWVEEPAAKDSVPVENFQPDSVQDAVPAPVHALAVHYAPPPPAAPVDVVELPLGAVFAKLPQDLQARARMPVNGQAQVTVPLAVVIPQLNRGSVKVSFGELRELAPANTFYPQSDRDQAVVELPLAEIFARLNPAVLARRQQKPVEVPDEIVSPFLGRGEGLQFYKPEAAPLPAFTRKVEEDFLAASEFPTRGHITSVPPQSQPSLPEPAPAIPVPAAPIRMPAPPQTRELVQAAAQPPAEANGAVLHVGLLELAENWPPAVRNDLAELHLLDATVALPLALVEEALKKGRAVFSWKQVRSWTNLPGPVQAVSPQDTVLLELPLKVLAPLFLTQRLAAKSRQKVAVGENIPDLFSFSKNGQAAKGNTDRFTAPKSSPPAAPAPKPADVPVEKDIFPEANHQTGKGRNSDALRSGTEFLKRYATPNDIVAKAVSHEGVAGALITLPDGLLVASQLPPAMDADALAGFLPQVFARLSQSAREYRVGELKDVTFTAGEAVWRIYKVGTIFFGVIGRVGEPLPDARLAALAAELDRKPKSS
jgi:predicted regulator of Ras-like GTPase activity (Roadblock/LC7/MglB family)